MNTAPLTPQDMRGVFAVPSLARKGDLSINFDQNEQLVRHVTAGGIRRLLYGGNAFLYHISLSDYQDLLQWLADLPDDLWVLPSVGPSFGRAMDQADLLRRHDFPAVMMLPCSDPRDAVGLERGLRAFADRAETPLILYLKTEESFGLDKEAGLDVVGRLVDDGTCVGIKYAVVRDDPREDTYLEQLLERVDRQRVISGIGERPAVVHMRDWQLDGFTTGSGCIAPHLCQALFEACTRGDYDEAEQLREEFMPLEDLRDAWGPSRVLHVATQQAELAQTGPVLPFLSMLSEEQRRDVKEATRSLSQRDEAHDASVVAQGSR